MTRLRAILCALYYGILPWWCYEREPHYDCSWVEHLCINLAYASRWALFQEDESDRDFEARLNPSLPGGLRKSLLLLPFLLLPACQSAEPQHAWRYRLVTEIQWTGIGCDSFTVSPDGRCANYYRYGQLAGRACGEFIITPSR